MNTQDLQETLAAHHFPLLASNKKVFTGNAVLERESPLGFALPSQIICNSDDVNSAVNEAAQAFRSSAWKDLPRGERKKVLLRWAALLEQHQETLAILDCAETGRALINFRHDSIPKAVEALRWFAELADKVDDRAVLEGQMPRKMSLVRREPIGVVAAVLPWNDPMVVYIWKVAPALVCGNAVVAKASEYAHHSIVLATRLAHEAGIPHGILQLLTGDGVTTGHALVTHPKVGAIGFTGSTQTGRQILINAQLQSFKRINLECGGKGAYIVSDNCNDIQAAARCLAKNAFYNQGQICSAATRAYIHRKVYDTFVEALLEETQRFAPSDPFTGETGVGFMINCQAVERVQNVIDRARHEKIALLSGGDQVFKGRAILPTIFGNVSPQTELSQKEIFGPVLTINAVDSISEAVEQANDSRYGLACAIWSDDLSEAMSASAALHTGTVHVNSYGEDDNGIPFGGIRESGLGREKSLDTLDSYSFIKSISVQLNSIYGNN